jgi:DNA modification methylase
VTVRILTGDCRELLSTLPAESVQTCVTSPPYFGLRDYGVAGQIGLEATPDAFVAELVSVFREVRRVLREDGTLWLNLGDSYAGSWGAQSREHAGKHAPNVSAISANLVRAAQVRAMGTGSLGRTPGLKAKDLIGIPWRVAFALQADGWYLRSDIIWAKPNPMPESVTDRPTKAHEYLFLLSKSERYFYDAKAIAEPVVGDPNAPRNRWDTKDYEVPGQKPQKRTQRKPAGWDTGAGGHGSFHREGRAQVVEHTETDSTTRNKRTVWIVATYAFPEAHFATFPPALIEPCILAGSARGDTVLDPFSGAGTTGLVADRLGRDAILCELNPQYAEMARRRITDDAPLFAGGAA